ncbi:MAG: Gfo/Idh/MocA family oxidoreductase [Phycisphaeraceae bacterium]|nr:Gfo/Idh/MocA family oxidoreductase [Phycisphaeraceae bacterium]
MSRRKRYAIVGTGSRAAMFIEAASKTYVRHADLVGFCDISQARMNYWNQRMREGYSHPVVPTYLAGQFDRMITETQPDVVIVASMDSTHHHYIVHSVELGCDVICEKPMTIDEQKAKAVLDAVARTGRKVTVTFNYRYVPSVTLVRDMVMSGRIGTPLAVDLMWTLNTSHGADYFRRWHREKDKSGGLLVHKATHHFDLVNFWVGSYPQTVFAMGDLKFYGRTNAANRGEHYEYDRYTDAPGAGKDPFAFDLRRLEELRGLYLDAEADSGYIRDRNVFGDNITIEDTMAVIARYHNGVQLSYSLVAYSPWEGLRACITGTKGRIELFEYHGSHVIVDEADKQLGNERRSEGPEVPGIGNFAVYYPMFGKPVELKIPEASGGHGGGDRLILEQLFLPNQPADRYCRQADHIDGAASILLGIAANRSIETGQPVDVRQLLNLEEYRGKDVGGVRASA